MTERSRGCCIGNTILAIAMKIKTANEIALLCHAEHSEASVLTKHGKGKIKKGRYPCE
jgi:hypothetical protein